MLGPTTGNNYDFIDAVYKAGAKGSFDAVAVHTDTGCLVAGPSEFYRDQGRVGRFSFLGYREVRKTILANGDDVPIWMTEFGWSSTQGPGGGPACERGASAGIKPSGVTAEQQATYLTQAAHCMGEDPYVEVANWFTLRDGSPTPGLDELEHYGLRSTRGAAKPSWDALRTLLTSGDPLSSPCGDFAGPSIVIETPRMGQTYTTNLPIRARARDAGGVARFTFLADGDPIRNFTEDLANDRPVELDWQGAKELSTGLHTIKVVAVDPQGNQQEAAVQVRKVGPEELQAVGPASFGSATGAGAGRGLAVRCARRRVCTVRGRVQSPAHTPLPGRVQVRWQRLSKVRGSKRPRWRTLHKRTRSAGRPFSFRQRLRRAGKWRVTVVYLPPRPLRRAQAPYAYFQVR
ncbi:MAG: hypothetical protein HZB46_11130 [Solirubrobacterales bacterium]|nr:hypothetical protein [Solirubrobacterales bacterium]